MPARRARKYNKRDLELARVQAARTAFDTVLLFVEASEQTGMPLNLKKFLKDAVALYEKRNNELQGI